jgi:L-threonylcarbamoyladenylate synthase
MLKDEINKALDTLSAGGIILYPTDTIWGIGCDASNADAVQKVIDLKGRSKEKSLIVLLDTDHKLQSYVNDVPDIAYDLIEYAEKPLTVIFSGARNLAPNVINEDGSVGIRIVSKHPFCTELLKRFRKPIVSTSANISGEPSPKYFDDISQAILDGVDQVIDYQQEDRSEKQPSTIMKLEADGRFSFIRR